MWQIIKSNLKKWNQWYDKQGESSRFWPLASLIILGLFLVDSNTTIISLFGWSYFGFFLVMRWLHVYGKL